MVLENYTPRVFVKNFIKDSEVFGEETTQAIYEEIFSTLSGKKVKLDSFVRALNEEVIEEEPITLASRLDAGDGIASGGVEAAAKAVEKAAETSKGAKAITGWAGPEHWAVTDKINQIIAVNAPAKGIAGFFSKIGSFLTGIPGKVKAFFGGLKGKSFNEIMQQGVGWLQANPMLALKTTGGIALVAMLIRALKKRGELKKYKQLERIAAMQQQRQATIKEDAYDTLLGDTPEKKAMRAIIEECQNNKYLNNLIFGE